MACVLDSDERCGVSRVSNVGFGVPHSTTPAFGPFCGFTVSCIGFHHVWMGVDEKKHIIRFCFRPCPTEIVDGFLVRDPRVDSWDCACVALMAIDLLGAGIENGEPSRYGSNLWTKSSKPV